MLRLDILTSKKFNISRTAAKELILRGEVLVGGEICIKPSNLFDEESIVETKGLKYVSRGGYKLEHALKVFGFNPNGICIDIGSSTGGFTDCLLKNGAKHVYAVDSGTNQLHSELKKNICVTSFENTNIKNFKLNFEVDLVTIDVSFISLEAVLPIAYDLLKKGGFCITLIKPQFELGKKGWVSKKNHKAILIKVKNIAESLNFKVENKTSYGEEYFYLLSKSFMKKSFKGY